MYLRQELGNTFEAQEQTLEVMAPATKPAPVSLLTPCLTYLCPPKALIPLRIDCRALVIQ